MGIKVGAGKAIHAAVETLGVTRCGRPDGVYVADTEVTCKRCLKALANVRDFYMDGGLRNYYEDSGPSCYSYARVPADELLTRHPFRHIDWDAVTEDDRSDYTSVELDGVTYYYLGG